jgi:hypothetical protein
MREAAVARATLLSRQEAMAAAARRAQMVAMGKLEQRRGTQRAQV